ncbi:hypothetical protein A3I53_01045 [Candidatus Curtissbacteria bacterium RIFCSPLOWO2_02_FULL_40_13b]|uniref:Bifunctional protein FolD n=1 Tax=Candidatus Curtissbacteria bacterium RIFCSPLOWO2_02_FULL_40_13b TaxID=1797733 RepID=A0A1F5HY11_9BACT|nr:MAG: hypothetical protein A3I53_01045 [Candidatus Curtissbacteria bacterium RIFCSPLOWO2_02_FULL_40_13b]
MAKILSGKIVNEKIAKELKTEISRRSSPSSGAKGSKPKLVIIQVGDLPESNAYIARKKAFGEKIGAIVDHQKFPENITQEKLITVISKLNTDSSVTGIIVQMPLPKHLDKDEIIESIKPQKDVDGLTSQNIKKLWENKNGAIIPATTKGVLSLLSYYKIPVSRQKVVIVGRSSLVGKPTLLAFLNNDATVTVCHKATKNLPEQTKSADILVVATGKPNLIGKEHVTKGQVVVDVGINVIESSENVIASNSVAISKKTAASLDKLGTRSDKSTKLIGDVDFDAVKNIVAAISPVPGGIGPMTVASLFQNLLDAYKSQN